MTDPRINALTQMKAMQEQAKSKEPLTQMQPETSFKEMMTQYLKDANDLQIKADSDIKKMIAGEDIDPHNVMIAVEKATMSFDLVMEIRNKMLEAYREIMKTQV